ncbi:chemotaxis protein MotC [Pararhizobium antarcticum]|uniref:Chemotaxis protein n=1 Tax=Pararhizobium antarcticum TaxID=1798805 RepID=A0A657LSC2_9HYPH|nr:chemotaxis protein MotC [Pararhizobium antarcticum]OJF95269.1 chemotaxis protein [Rhizobium sp. 58]OJF95402.1 chemotaxis protein [Pararhizobium antarcticum]
MIKALRFLLLCASALGAPMAQAEDFDDLPPYKILRSLQFIQDSVVLGDHSAIEMQRYMLGAIDKRLRTAGIAQFEDPRNIDAALIYAMSGGNPETLDFLTSRDIEGNFDSRITDALRQYLNGKGALIVANLVKTIPEYRNTRIGPYLYLILGNAASLQDPKAAMGYYDWARLMAPGTIIEEAALRRSISLSMRGGMPEKGFSYSLSYARRFMTSPYVGQFADIFVELAVANFNAETEGKITEILEFMDRPRQREVYLRIARRAAIAGLQPLARLAAQRAEALSDVADSNKALASLYAGLVDVPSADILAAVSQMSSIPEQDLSPRDRALLQAARAVAQEVLKAPDPDSLTQATVSNVTTEASDGPSGSGESPFADPAVQGGEQPVEGGEQQVTAPESKSDPEHDNFLASSRSKIDEIDMLLKGEVK